MQPNYEELMKKQQQDYQRSRNPFEYGQQVAKRRYSEIISGLQNQGQSMQKSYGDLYSQVKQGSVKNQAMGGPTLSGGMEQQARDYTSALETQQLGQIGSQRIQSMQDLYSQGQAAFSNAQLEGQQATQMDLQNQQTNLQIVQQKQALLADTSLTEEQRAEQLDALGIDYTQEDVGGGNNALAGIIGGAVGIGAAFKLAAAGKFGTTIGVAALDLSAKLAPTLKAGGILSKLGGFGKVLGIAGKAVPWLALAWGAEKVIELIQGKGAEGGLIGSEGLIKLGNLNI